MPSVSLPPCPFSLRQVESANRAMNEQWAASEEARGDTEMLRSQLAQAQRRLAEVEGQLSEAEDELERERAQSEFP